MNWSGITNLPPYPWMPDKLLEAVAKAGKLVVGVLKARDRATALEEQLQPWRVQIGETDRGPFFSAVLPALERELEARQQLAVIFAAAVEAVRIARQKAEAEVLAVEQQISKELGLWPEQMLPPAPKQCSAAWWAARHSLNAIQPEQNFCDGLRQSNEAATAAQQEIERYRKLLAGEPGRIRELIANRDRKSSECLAEEEAYAEKQAEREKMQARVDSLLT
jgi:hypothetical protein